MTTTNYNMVLEENDHFVKNELLTDKELAAIKWPRRVPKTKAVRVIKDSVYCFFGARFGEVRTFRVSGHCSINPLSPLLIQFSKDSERARLGEFCRPDNFKVYRWQKIKYTKGGEPYVVWHGRHYKLDLFMRMDYPLEPIEY